MVVKVAIFPSKKNNFYGAVKDASVGTLAHNFIVGYAVCTDPRLNFFLKKFADYGKLSYWSIACHE